MTTKKSTKPAVIKPAPVPRGEPTSVANQIAALQIGESLSRVKAMPADLLLAEYGTTFNEMRVAMSSNMRPAITRAVERAGGKYELNVVEARTSSASNSGITFFVVAIVTRVA